MKVFARKSPCVAAANVYVRGAHRIGISVVFFITKKVNRRASHRADKRDFK